MADFVTKKVAKHIFKEHAGNKQGSNDPYFEYAAATDMNGNATGKTIKRKRPVPPGLTKQEEKVLKKVTRRAYRLDNALNICGIRVGWSVVAGLVPVLGDFFDVIMAVMVFNTCMQVGIPNNLKSKMTFNIAVDFVVGLVPFLGDVADAFWRCNTKNAALLYNYLEARGAERIRSGQEKAELPRRESPHQNQGNIIEQLRTVRNEMQVPRSAKDSKAASPSTAPIREPKPAPTRDSNSSGGGWLTRFGGRKPQPVTADLENGDALR